MGLSSQVIEMRLEKLREYLEVLKSSQAISRADFVSIPSNHYTVERCLQLAIECCIDIGGHVISALGLKRPEEFRDIFLILRGEGYMERELAETMAQMASFRNQLVHVYWDLDSNKVYDIVQNNLGDFHKFENWVLDLMEKQKAEDEKT